MKIGTVSAENKQDKLGTNVTLLV